MMYVVGLESDLIGEFLPSGKRLQVWGGFGDGPGQFDHPTGAAVGPHGKRYIADTGNHRIQKLTITGWIWRPCSASLAPGRGDKQRSDRRYEQGVDHRQRFAS
jgi:hypothetical protein